MPDPVKRIPTKLGTMRLRLADVDDADRVLSLFTAVVNEEIYLATSPVELNMTVSDQAEIIRYHRTNHNSVFFIGQIGKELAGFCSVCGGSLLRSQHVAELQLHVHPEMRAGGVGSALLESTLSWARTHAVLRKIRLSVFSDNQPALALYQKFGFEIEGRGIGDFQEQDGRLRDRLLMGKWLSD